MPAGDFLMQKLLLLALTTSLCFAAQDGPQLRRPDDRPFEFQKVDYRRAVERTAQMASQPEAHRLANQHGLDVLNVTWEDTGRYKGSAVGPNISDMTIQVVLPDERGGNYQSHAMPVIRFPNFSDKAADIDPSFFTVLVGNEKGRPLRRVSLREFLESPDQFMTNPNSWLGGNRTLAASRDSHVLVSAQACFLPVPRSGKATFNPVLFNYQSVTGDPAVLTILATREGTSMTIIDNKDNATGKGVAWGQPLFFNQKGQRASLTGERLSDFAARPGNEGSASRPAEESGLNMVLLIQVPLKQKNPMRPGGFGAGGFGGGGGEPGALMESMSRAGSDVEAAVIGHGPLEGPFEEVKNLNIERDERFPVRVTVQFYKATSNGVVSPQDMSEIKRQIDRVYAHGDYVGSLVVQGETGRPTEYWGMKVQPAGWWEAFWRRHEENTGESREEAMAKLRKLLGPQYLQRPVCDLYLGDVLRR